MNFIKNFSLRSKLIVIILSTVIVSSVTGFTFFLITENRTLENKMIIQSVMTAKLVSEYLQAPLDFGYIGEGLIDEGFVEEAEDILEKLEALPNVTQGYAFDVESNIFAEFERDTNFVSPNIPAKEKFTDGVYYDLTAANLLVFKRIENKDNEFKGTLCLIISTEQLKAEINSQIIIAAIIMLVVIIFAFVLALLMQKFVSRPILELADFAIHISEEGVYNKSIAKYGDDETGQLYDSFNEMLRKIEEANRELAESEERYRVMAEEIADVMWTMNTDFEFTYVSPSIMNQRGFTRQEAETMRLEDVMTKESYEKIMPKLFDKKSMIELGSDEGWQPFEVELELFKKDGTTIWTRNNARYFKTPDGKAGGLIGLTTDITVAKNAQTALKASEKKYRTYIENAPEGIFVADSNGRYIEVNKSACTMTGFTKTELLDMNIGQLASPEAPPSTLQSFDTLRTKGTVEDEVVLRKKDGTDIIVILKALEMEPGKYIAFCIDITQRKEDERIIRETGELLQAALSQSPSGILIADAPDVKIRMANKAAFGIRKGSEEVLTGIEVEKHSINWQTYDMEGNQYPPEKLPLSRAVIEGEVVENEEIIIRDETGADRYVSANAAPIYNDAGEVRAGIVVFSDITERKTALMKLEDSNMRMALAADSAGIGIWDYHVEEDILYWDEWMFKLYGVNPDDFEGRLNDWRKAIHSDDLQAIESAFKAAITSDAEFDEEFRILKNGNEIRYIKGNALVSRDEKGTGVRVIGTNFDITERKKHEARIEEQNKQLSERLDEIKSINNRLHEAKEVLERNEIKLKRTQNLAKVGGWEYNVATKAFSADKIAQDNYGLIFNNEIDISVILDNLLPEYKENLKNEFEKAVAGEKYDLEFKFKKPSDGTIAHLHSIGEYNPLLNKITGAVQDITEQKAQEEQITQFFDVNLDLLAIADYDGHFLKVNAAWEDVIGYTPAELEGIEYIKLVHPDDVDQTYKAMGSLNENEKIWNFVNRYKTKKGDYRFIEWRAIGALGVVYAAARDITERMAAEKALKISEERLNKALAAVHDGVWDWDLASNGVFFDDRYYTMAGYNPGDFPQKGFPLFSKLGFSK